MCPFSPPTSRFGAPGKNPNPKGQTQRTCNIVTQQSPPIGKNFFGPPPPSSGPPHPSIPPKNLLLPSWAGCFDLCPSWSIYYTNLRRPVQRRQPRVSCPVFSGPRFVALPPFCRPLSRPIHLLTGAVPKGGQNKTCSVVSPTGPFHFFFPMRPKISAAPFNIVPHSLFYASFPFPPLSFFFPLFTRFYIPEAFSAFRNDDPAGKHRRQSPGLHKVRAPDPFIVPPLSSSCGSAPYFAAFHIKKDLFFVLDSVSLLHIFTLVPLLFCDWFKFGKNALDAKTHRE